MPPPKVYLDTTALKFSATELPRLLPRNTSIQWGEKTFDVTVHDLVEVNPNDAITNAELRAEADHLPRLANLGKIGAIEFIMCHETRWESWGLPNMDSKGGEFYGAPITAGAEPLEYSRIVASSRQDSRSLQYDFLCSIENQRFLDLQKITGAYQGKQPRNHNQLLDAFHIWSAERNACEFFLSLDFKLINVLSRPENKPRVRVQLVRPSELLRLVAP